MFCMPADIGLAGTVCCKPTNNVLYLSLLFENTVLFRVALQPTSWGTSSLNWRQAAEASGLAAAAAVQMVQRLCDSIGSAAIFHSSFPSVFLVINRFFHIQLSLDGLPTNLQIQGNCSWGTLPRQPSVSEP